MLHIRQLSSFYTFRIIEYCVYYFYVKVTQYYTHAMDNCHFESLRSNVKTLNWLQGLEIYFLFHINSVQGTLCSTMSTLFFLKNYVA